MNKVILLGRLTKDPELKFAPGTGTAICTFTLAVNRMKKDDPADFINCVAFNKNAENIAQYMSKGRQIAIEGNIKTGSYTAKDGTKRYTTDINVEKFDFIGSANGNGNNQEYQQNNKNSYSGTPFMDGMTPVDDEEMPF